MYLLIQQCPVRVPKAVDALFHITNDQVVFTLRQALLHERTEIVPLHTAGVLELINHIMVNLRTGLLIDEGGITAMDHLA